MFEKVKLLSLRIIQNGMIRPMKNLYKTKPLQLFHWLNLSLLITSGIFLSACASMEETADQDMKGEQQEVTSTPETKPASSESQSKVTATPYTMGNSPSTDPVNGDTAVKQNMTPSQPAEKRRVLSGERSIYHQQHPLFPGAD